ncbi:methyl-accepting chemotaxis protein [Ekhidna sp. To15]|uniref:methyl-accepting chemotaxis protein n=1 Tax=Ekhidna sp. To15 TaxID=3395267 RepID=UPI003F52515F
MNWFKKEILYAGTDSGMEDIIKNRIFYANSLILFLIPLLTTLSLVQIASGVLEAATETLILLPVPIISFILNRMGFHKYGRLFLLYGVALYLSLSFYYFNLQFIAQGIDPGMMRLPTTKIHLWPVIVGTAVIFDFKRERTFFNISLIGIFLSYLFFDDIQALLGLPVSELPFEDPSFLKYNISTTATSFIILFELYLLVSVNQKFEKSIVEQKEQLKVKSEESDIQREELEKQQSNLLNAVNETEKIISHVVDSGNYSLRMDTSDHTGEWKKLGESINSLFESLLKPFQELDRIVNHLAAGDLKERYQIDSKGEVLQLSSNLNKALDTVSELITDIVEQAEKIKSIAHVSNQNSEQVAVQITEMSQVISEISSGAGNQVMQVNNTSGLVENIMTSSSQISKQAESINGASSSGVEKSKNGVDTIEKVGDSFQDVLMYFDKSTASINDLSKYSSEISGILSIIRSIASQTNLLALNAAIEAAQAGDAGKGFSVISDEIRKLAEQSQQSVKEIEELVGNVQRSAAETSKFIADMNGVVKDSEGSVRNAQTSFSEILKSYNTTFDISNDIVKSTQKQTQDVKQIVSLIEQIVVISEETAAGSEQAATSAKHVSDIMQSYHDLSYDISQIAEDLTDKTGRFSLKEKEMVTIRSTELSEDELMV